uniref:Autophagy-related protein 3 n=1 Tax=Chlamydomonas euryale TaxID=1486919 RepID=A0A7R9UZA6_9CHLO
MGMRHAVHTLFKSAAEAVLPPLTKSAFSEKGVLTPEEFVAAGDYLCRACPTWAWEGGDARKRRGFLPADKQYLVTRNVPCTKRAKELEQYDPSSEFTLGGDEEGWTATHSDPNHPQAGAAADDIPDMDDGGDKKEDEDDIPDIGELELHADDDEAALSAATTSRDKKYMTAAEPEDTVLRTRTYDLYMTYDQYYQCPRFWLVGYDESRHPLAPDQVMDDVSEEHARKTITVDPHPNLSLVAASIHPCKHAEVMKKLVDNIVEGGGSFQVEHYLLLFLKFISSVVPTIQYDYTMSIGQ